MRFIRFDLWHTAAKRVENFGAPDLKAWRKCPFNNRIEGILMKEQLDEPKLTDILIKTLFFLQSLDPNLWWAFFFASLYWALRCYVVNNKSFWPVLSLFYGVSNM